MTRRARLEPTDACREYALTLLDRRAYTVLQLSRKLRARQFSLEIVQQTLDELVRLGLVDDLAFAKAYATEKTRGFQPVGQHRIRAALQKKGVSSECIEQALREIESDETVPDEMGRALIAADRKWQRIQRTGVPVHNARSRLARFLFGRGFPSDVVREVVDRTVEKQ